MRIPSGNLLFLVLVSHFGARLHRPRLIGAGCFLMAAGSFLTGLPHFFMGRSADHSLEGKSTGPRRQTTSDRPPVRGHQLDHHSNQQLQNTSRSPPVTEHQQQNTSETTSLYHQLQNTSNRTPVRPPVYTTSYRSTVRPPVRPAVTEHQLQITTNRTPVKYK